MAKLLNIRRSLLGYTCVVCKCNVIQVLRGFCNQERSPRMIAARHFGDSIQSCRTLRRNSQCLLTCHDQQCLSSMHWTHHQPLFSNLQSRRDWRTLWVRVFARKEQDDSEEKLGTHDEMGWNMTEPIEDVFWSCMLILLTRSKQQQPANLFCDCPSCSHNKQQELLSVFRGLHSSNYQLQLLRCLLPVHLPL